jgi:hypothetical protein
VAALLLALPAATDGALVLGAEGAIARPAFTEGAALLLDRPPATSGALVLGATGGDVPVYPPIGVRLACTLPGPSVRIRARYVSGAARPVVGEVRARFQDAGELGASTRARWQDSTASPLATGARWQRGQAAPSATAQAWRDAQRLGRDGLVARYQDGLALGAEAASRFAQARRQAIESAVRFQEARDASIAALARFQDARRGLGGAQRVRWQDGISLPLLRAFVEGYARPASTSWRSRYQDAIAPRPGVSPGDPIVPPKPPPCYTPSGALLLATPWSDSAALLLICDGVTPGPIDPDPPASLVVIPILRKYLVLNSATLRRVDTGAQILASSMTLGLDVDSWTWCFTARVPGSALDQLTPSASSGPVEVEARVNGVAYRILVESLSRERSFGASDLSVKGRGRAALLDAPYVPVQAFRNTGARTAQQLAEDALTFNGVGLGWAIDWRPDDWLVPAGTWSHQGTYISALNAIADAAGAYVQPHRTQQQLAILRRYPAKPWEWNDVTPDYELPVDLVERESIAWIDRPNYNRVIVRGVDQAGVLGIATRAGTAGDVEAPMVTDPLITSEVAARQRALPVLANVGRQLEISLRLPVLAETGIIPPGKFVRYVDAGVRRVGLVRSTNASVERTEESLTVWQTLGVESHVTV